MHTIVDIIPSLLHLSLFAFFGGLVAFLNPINPVLQWLVVGSLVIIACTYIIFTMMPVIDLSSPYQTPLSPIIWRSWQTFWWTLEKLFGLHRLASRFCWGVHIEEVLPTSSHRQYNLTYAMVAASNKGRQEREHKSMVWTLKSLNDDTQLLPFVEALPDVIFGLEGKIRIDNLHLIKPILETTDPDVDIIGRIFSLIRHAQDNWSKERHRERCIAAIPNALWALAYALNWCPEHFDLRKTGRSSWFTWEQVRVLESHKDTSLWILSTVALFKSNIMMCQEMDFNPPIPYSPVTSFTYTLPDSTKQAEILLEYLEEAIQKLPNYVCMASSTFHALKGHRYARTLNTTPIYELLIQRLSTVVPQGETKESESTNLPLWDVLCYDLLQICNKDMLPVISRCLNERMKHSIDIKGPGPWIPCCQREDNHIPGYVPLLRAVMANGEYTDDCITTLRDIIWCFDKPIEGGRLIDHLDPRWWIELEPTWLEVLSQIETKLSEDADQSSLLASLAIMIKGMVLKKSYPPPPAKEKVKFDLAGFISNHISSSIPIEPWPTEETIRPAFLVLILQQLEYIDIDEPKSITTAENTLRFLGCKDLRGVAYEVDPALTQRLASQTRRCCELWGSEPSSMNLVTILEDVFTLWEDSNEFPRVPANEIPIPEDVISNILQAADIIITSERPVEDESEVSQDSGGESSDTVSRRLSRLIELASTIKATWDQHEGECS